MRETTKLNNRRYYVNTAVSYEVAWKGCLLIHFQHQKLIKKQQNGQFLYMCSLCYSVASHKYPYLSSI